MIKRHILFASIKVLDVSTVLKIRVWLVSLAATSVIVARGHACRIVAAIIAILASSGIALNTIDLRRYSTAIVLHILNV